MTLKNKTKPWHALNDYKNRNHLDDATQCNKLHYWVSLNKSGDILYFLKDQNQHCRDLTNK